MLRNFWIALALSAPLIAADVAPGLTVHEWGTFTTVAGADGYPEQWVSLAPPTDLPCFVYHVSQVCVKCGPHKVRMETPVIYFYSAAPLTASVHVDFPSGMITEWYPQATPEKNPMLEAGYIYGHGGKIEWSHVEVTPGAPPDFPNAGDASHYYAARETDASPLRVGDQTERVLFYRGIASFDIPVAAKFLPDGKLEVRNSGDALPVAVVFENRDDKVGFRVLRNWNGKDLMDSPDLTAGVASVRQELSEALVASGLYPKEAAAMIATWGDSWFEEGMRIFYVMPRKTVDSVLPLRISPAPTATERVFVGRVEVLSPYLRSKIETALGNGDTRTLARCSRFLRPWADRIMASSSTVRMSQAASTFLAGQSSNPSAPAKPCKVEPAVLPTEQQQH